MIDMINNMLIDISKHKRNREELLRISIEDRLNKSLEVYYNQLSASLEYLASKDSLRVLKNIK